MLFKLIEKNKNIITSPTFKKIIIILFIICLTLGLFEALILSPSDYLQSDAVRLSLIHI